MPAVQKVGLQSRAVLVCMAHVVGHALQGDYGVDMPDANIAGHLYDNGSII